MRRSVVASVVAGVLITAAVVAGAVTLLRGGAADELVNGAAETGVSATLGRPACPGPEVGGVALPCLGAEVEGAASTSEPITLVSVWAWWCVPCREELPLLQQYAAAHPDTRVVGVHADKNEANGAALLAELGVDMPSYQDSSGVFAGELGLPGVVPILLVYRGEEQLGVFPRAFTSVAEIEDAVAGVL